MNTNTIQLSVSNASTLTLGVSSKATPKSYLPLNSEELASYTRAQKYPLRGTIESYTDPTEPVGEDDWEVLE